ncbi:MAG TPA: SfnB family sulfur acquisition oxidoreductase [Polyangiaceae bacterium]|nr:SfnB family sulfur acquisition oxidoreductase [Polyangiaceae bacterium]
MTLNSGDPVLFHARSGSSSSRLPERVRVLKTDAEAIAAAEEVAAVIRAGASERDRKRELPHKEVELLSTSGLYGATVPRAFGGAEIKSVTVAEVFRILSAADPSIGQIPQNHVAFVESIREGTPEQQKFYFQRFLAGERIGNALSEATNKNGMAGFRTRLVRTEGGYLINGAKAYCTGALFAHWIPIFALDEENVLRMAYVRSQTRGLSFYDDWSGMGQRTTASGTIDIENVFVSDFELITPFKGDKARVGSAWSQIPHAAIDLGIAEEAFRDALEHIRTRSRPWHGSTFERLSDEPLIIQRIGEWQQDLDAARLFLRRGAELVDAARADTTPETTLAAAFGVAQARIATDRVSLRITNELFELCGTKSSFAEFNFDRHWRNARTHTLHDPIRWKTQYLGNYVLNGVLPPKNALI